VGDAQGAKQAVALPQRERQGGRARKANSARGFPSTGASGEGADGLDTAAHLR